MLKLDFIIMILIFIVYLFMLASYSKCEHQNLETSNSNIPEARRRHHHKRSTNARSLITSTPLTKITSASSSVSINQNSNFSKIAKKTNVISNEAVNITKEASLVKTESINATKATNYSKTSTVPPHHDRATKIRYKEVMIKQGKIRGRVIHTQETGDVFTYLGIPYAESPTGPNRFKKPTQVQSWKEKSVPRDALEYAPSCYQWKDESFESYKKGFRGTAMWNTNTKKSEDCLFLNVWTPANPKQSKQTKLAVMVWIYGGSFYGGTSSLEVYNGLWLAGIEKVVVVSMNYRVGGLGFLAIDDEEIPGNAGLFDQQLALLWVKENIHVFGGDKNKVTLFGESSGAASISLQLLSKKSNNLFRNVILQSASFLSPWSILEKTEAKRRGLKLAQALNCTGAKTNLTDHIKFQSMVSCLKSVDPQVLVDTEIFLEGYGIAKFPNAAVVDNDFLDFSPHNLSNLDMVDMNVNVLAGFNANEGNYFLVYSDKPKYDLTTENKLKIADFKLGVSEILRSMDGYEKSNQTTKIILEEASNFFYTEGFKPTFNDIEEKKEIFVPGGERFSLHNDKRIHKGSMLRAETFYRDRLDDMVGDINFVCPTLGFLDLFVKHQKMNEKSNKQAYLYKFVHRSSQNPWPKWMGVMHGYEIEFVFGIPLNESNEYNLLEKNISRSIMKMWSNFAKHGKPTNNNSYWPPYTEKRKFIYIIGESTKEISVIGARSSLYASKYSNQLNHCAFWGKYFPALQSQLHKLQSTCSNCPRLKCSIGLGSATSLSFSLSLVFFIILTTVVKTSIM